MTGPTPDPTADPAGRRTPRTEAGRALLASLHAQAPVVVPIEQDAAAICRIEDEARAAGPREAPLDVDALAAAIEWASGQFIARGDSRQAATVIGGEYVRLRALATEGEPQ